MDSFSCRKVVMPVSTSFSVRATQHAVVFLVYSLGVEIGSKLSVLVYYHLDFSCVKFFLICVLSLQIRF